MISGKGYGRSGKSVRGRGPGDEFRALAYRLLVRVEAGEDVVIARRGEPVARLVGSKPRKKRQPNVLKGRVIVPKAFLDAQPEEELAAWDAG